MSSSDWTLIAFTLSIQFSVGIVLLYNLFLLFPLALKKEKIPFRYRMILLVALLIAFTGVVISFLHLGSPIQATKALANLGSSWLSREILLVISYSGMLLVVTGLQFKFPLAVRSYKWLLDLTTVTGLILVYVMSRIYLIPTVPAWNSIFTPIGFFAAMLLSGSCLLLLFQLTSGSWACQKGLTILIIAVPVVQLGLLPIHMSWLGESGDAARQSLDLLLNQFLPAFYLRLGLEVLTLAFGIWAFFSVRSDTLKKRNLFVPALLALLAALGAMVTDRFLFYAQQVPLLGI